MKRILVLALLVPLLGGCFQTVTGSVAGSECKVFEAPRYAIRGATPYDQDWADSTVEGGVGACKWKRPAPRPPEMDAPKPARKAVAAPLAKSTKKKPPLWLNMLRAPLIRTKPVVASPAVLPAPEPPAPVTAAPPARRSAIDELLHPSEVIAR